MPGLDGGTYITRSDVLRGQSWALSVRDGTRSTRGGDASTCVPDGPVLDKREERNLRFCTCALTGEVLREPVVSDYLGCLYNREAVLEFLLARKHTFADEQAQHRYINQLREHGTALDHLTSTRDVFTVHLPTQPSGGSSGGGAGAVGCSVHRPAATCPITDLPCDWYPFCALATCGHVFSCRAISQVMDALCPSCSAQFANDDVITLNGRPEEVLELRQRLAARMAARTGAKKQKRKRGQDGGPEAVPGDGETGRRR